MHEFARLARTYLKQYWARLLLAIVLTSMAAMSPFFFTYMGKIIVDDVLEIPAKAPAPEELSQEDPASPFADHDYLKPNEELDGTIDTAFLSKTGKTPGQKVKLLFLTRFDLAVHGNILRPPRCLPCPRPAGQAYFSFDIRAYLSNSNFHIFFI